VNTSGTVASSRSSSGASLPDPYGGAWERVAEAVLDSEGTLPSEVRRAIARGRDPEHLAPLLRKVRAHAYRIVDADVAGLDTDVVYEAVLAAAFAEGDERRRAALEAIG
jgi:hypothetical protein